MTSHVDECGCAKLTLRMDIDLREAVDRRAMEMGITASELVRLAIAGEMGNDCGIRVMLPSELLRQIDSEVEHGLFLDRDDAIRHYLRVGMNITSAEVFL